MPVTIKTAAMKYKNSGGTYVGIDAVAETTTSQQVTAINNAGAAQVAAVQAQGATTIASIPQDYTTLSNNVSDLQSALDSFTEYQTNLGFYLFKENYYVNSSGVDTALAGYNIYKIPTHDMTVVQIKWDSPFWYQLGSSHVVKLQKTDDSYINIGTDTSRFVYDTTNKEIVCLCDSTIKYVVINGYGADEGNAVINVNQPYPDLKGVVEYSYSRKLNSKNTIVSKETLTNSNVLTPYSGNIYSYILPIKCGDRIRISNPPDGLSNRFSQKFTDNSVIAYYYSSQNHTFVADGIVFIAFDENTVVEYLPCDDNYTDIPAVAFGTSLTYRSQTTGGYLQYLPSLSNAVFDNQGIGSSTILEYGELPNMLAAIKAYASYASKDIVIIEGFVNDWYYNGASLGTWQDTAETSVCGCLRSAINYVLTQNPYATVFLVLDHYGSGITASAALNNAGETQLEFYEELAKVAESLGVYVIKLYAESGINEKTTQYLIDNIHPSAAGALQTALTIWNGMKNRGLKVQNKTS